MANLSPEQLPVVEGSHARPVLIEAEVKAKILLGDVPLYGVSALMFGLCEIIGELRARVDKLEAEAKQFDIKGGR